MVSPGNKRAAVVEVVEEGLCSLRAAARAVGLSWSSFCYRAKKASDWMVRLVGEITFGTASVATYWLSQPKFTLMASLSMGM